MHYSIARGYYFPKEIILFFLLKTLKKPQECSSYFSCVDLLCVLKNSCKCIYFSSVFTYRYFDVDPSAALFHIEPHHNTSGFWSIWFTNNFDFSIELNEVFIARVTNVLKVSFISAFVFDLRIWSFDIQNRTFEELDVLRTGCNQLKIKLYVHL